MKKITFDPSKELPRPRSGDRVFIRESGEYIAIAIGENEVSPEVFQELEKNPSFSALKDSGAIVITEIQTQKTRTPTPTPV